MDIKPCPKCGSTEIALFTNICETITNGWGIRLQCKNKDCNFTPPKSKWQFYSSEKAVEIWNKYKRKYHKNYIVFKEGDYVGSPKVK